MSRRRYVKDYRINEYIDEKGYVTSESEYIGGDYRFVLPTARVHGSAKRVAALGAVGWACFLVLACVEGTAMRTIYVALPFAFSALPLFLLMRSAISALRAKDGPLRHDQADSIAHTLPAAALWAMLLPGASFLGCLISSLAGAEEWDVLFLALSAVMTACGALCFAARGDFATKKR